MAKRSLSVFALRHLASLGSRSLYRLSFLPFLVSGPVLGIGLIRMWNHSGALGMVYDSFAIMILACVGRYLVFAHHGTAAALADLHRNMEEAAQVHGIPWHRHVTGIVVPLVFPTLIGVWGLGFVLSLAEVDAIILVYPPGFTTLGVRLFSLMHYGPSSTVAALCVINVLMVLGGAAVLALLHAWTRKALDAGH
ncbi:MAG: ABC transporter permease subunit [Thermodesulfobacteriota bacterium]